MGPGSNNSIMGNVVQCGIVVLWRENMGRFIGEKVETVGCDCGLQRVALWFLEAK